MSSHQQKQPSVIPPQLQQQQVKQPCQPPPQKPFVPHTKEPCDPQVPGTGTIKVPGPQYPQVPVPSHPQVPGTGTTKVPGPYPTTVTPPLTQEKYPQVPKTKQK
ncbi:cornifin-like [Sarcophilus harrisii]|uniref:Small proline rich protein 3 n=1 Tax=Sarcophilus harrisii TaxID=9305 RepID=G3VC69_SARHA|nr:cornifin-like [Sarcophilus harrisii]